MEPAVLHSGRPNTPGRPVLDVPGIAKEHGLLRITVLIVVGVIARDVNGADVLTSSDSDDSSSSLSE
jgi:hypothetical protein